jgi:dihydrofolate reductase
MGVICHHTMSLDGYIAGPDDSMDWAFALGQPTSLADDTMKRIGAILAGRRWYDMAIERWTGSRGSTTAHTKGRSSCSPIDHPRRAPAPGSTSSPREFERAVATAQAAAGDKDVGIFGATLSRQCLRSGLLDEIVTSRLCCSATHPALRRRGRPAD